VEGLLEEELCLQIEIDKDNHLEAVVEAVVEVVAEAEAEAVEADVEDAS
jgi:hypothetical protein